MTSIPLLTSPSTQGPFFLITQQVNPMAVLWNNLGSASAITITGGNIDGTVIGATTPASGTFSTLSSAGTVDFHAATVIFASGQLSGNYISGGTINNVNVVLNANPTTNLQAATKQYVDSAVSSSTGLSWQNLAVTGQSTLTAGSSTDTLHIASAGSNIAITTNTGTKTLSIGFTGTLPTGSVPTFTGDVTNSGLAMTIGANVITNAKSAQMVGHTYKGNNTGSTANPADITSTQLTADLNQFTSTLQGMVPPSGTPSGNFLRDDKTWALPNSTNPIATFVNTISDASPITPAAYTAWTIAPLPSTIVNTISGCSISSSIITLPVGRYYFKCSLNYMNPNSTYSQTVGLRLKNTTTATTISYNQSSCYLNNGNIVSTDGYIIVSGSPNTFQLQYYFVTGAGGAKIGAYDSMGDNINAIIANFIKIG